MKLDKYLNEMHQLSWDKLSSATKKAIEKLEKETGNNNRISELIDDVVGLAFNDGVDRVGKDNKRLRGHLR
jgi:hypothetical protein